MLKHRKFILVCAVAILLITALALRAELSDPTSSSTGNSDKVNVVSGRYLDNNRVDQISTGHSTPNSDLVGTSIPPRFSDMKELLLRDAYGTAWSSDTERHLNQLAISTNTISDFKATCRKLGCVISGRINLPSQDADSLSQVSGLIEKDSSLSSMNSAGDRYIEYKIASIDPIAVTFTAIGFKR